MAIAHLHPDRLREQMTAAGLDTALLATASGLRARFLDEALGGHRRLGVAAMNSLAGPLGVDWWALRCDHATGQRRCSACGAPNLLTEADLADAIEAIGTLLAQAREQQVRAISQLAGLPGFDAARAALVAVGADLDPDRLTAIGADAVLAMEPTDVAARVAEHCGGGDLETDELVGLDISGDIPNGLRVAGWTLVRFDEAALEQYEIVPGAVAGPFRSWDRTSAERTWWLRRPAGVRPAVSGSVISFAEPADHAVAPRFALALLKQEPPGVLSHGWAQRGRGVSLSVASRQLDYIVEDDGYPNMQYGPYDVEDDKSAQWAACVVHIGDLIERVFATSSEPAARYAATAEQFLGVAADLNHGWNPLPRLALEMSTVGEMLLLSGAGEEISRRVRIAAAWLGGVDDADRDMIHDFTKKLYDAGSAYRHGGGTWGLHRGGPLPAGKKHLDVLRAYRLLRRLMLHGLAVVASGESPAELCDRAQRSETARVRLAELVAGLYADLGVTPRSFPTA